MEDALLRGEEANLMYLGEFNDDNKAPSIEGFEAVNMEVQYNALSSQADVLKLLSGIKSTDDIKDCFYRAFARQTAEKFINCCRPLRIHKIGDEWLLDQSYEGGSSWYTWDQ